MITLFYFQFDLHSSEEITENGITKDDIIADSFLALIGAIHLHEVEPQNYIHVNNCTRDDLTPYPRWRSAGLANERSLVQFPPRSNKQQQFFFFV